ncbi:MAG: hypothetical protein O9342_16845 [Beijerinckiaceae bacterium]|nr:hypothetical protein [Beijerinckiaceae bacterium]
MAKQVKMFAGPGCRDFARPEEGRREAMPAGELGVILLDPEEDPAAFVDGKPVHPVGASRDEDVKRQAHMAGTVPCVEQE